MHKVGLESIAQQRGIKNPVAHAATILNFESDVDLLRHCARTGEIDEDESNAHIDVYVRGRDGPNGVFIPYFARRNIERALIDEPGDLEQATIVAFKGTAAQKKRRRRKMVARRHGIHRKH
jgi:hypothetical protein